MRRDQTIFIGRPPDNPNISSSFCFLWYVVIHTYVKMINRIFQKKKKVSSMNIEIYARKNEGEKEEVVGWGGDDHPSNSSNCAHEVIKQKLIIK